MEIILALVAERKLCLSMRPGEGLKKALELSLKG